MQAIKHAGIPQSAESSAANLLSPDVHERYLELSRRPRSSACACCGAEAGEGGKKLQVCSTCRRKAYCSAACQRQDWNEGGHKRSCQPQKDFRKDDVVVAQSVVSQPELNGRLFLVVGPAAAGAEGRWQVTDAKSQKSISLHADKLRLVVAAEEREGVVPRRVTTTCKEAKHFAPGSGFRLLRPA